MNRRRDLDPFARIGFDDFRAMALDSSLTQHEKIGTPDSYPPR
jgi:hypothetical protein